MHCSIEDIIADFPDSRIAFVLAENLSIAPERSSALDGAISQAEEVIRARYSGQELASISEIQDWRQAYKGFGIKKTSYRSSVERLVKNALAGQGLPRINALVDCYNLISLSYIVPIGADDCARLAGGISFRRAREGDEFFTLGGDGVTNDPPKPGEVVYADEEKILCRRWNWRQDARSPVNLDTHAAILTVQAQTAVDLEAACHGLCQALEEHCGAATSYSIANKSAPSVELDIQS